MNSLKHLALTAQGKTFFFIRHCSLGLVLKLNIYRTSCQDILLCNMPSLPENQLKKVTSSSTTEILKMCFISVHITKIHILFTLELLVILYVAAVWPHSLPQQHFWQLWSPAVATRSADQLSPKWQATAESIHLEAPGDSTCPHAPRLWPSFRSNGDIWVSLATHSGKVKRVSLEMLMRKSAKQQCGIKKKSKPVRWRIDFQFDWWTLCALLFCLFFLIKSQIWGQDRICFVFFITVSIVSIYSHSETV